MASVGNKRLLNKVGIDRAIVYTIFYRLVQAFGGAGTVFFIARYLTKDQQGYYYTFGSLIAIQVFFELGLCSIITQFVAHEMAHLTWSDEHRITGAHEHTSRVASLMHFCVKWFSIIAMLFFMALIISGFYFFSHYSYDSDIEWKKPWIILALATSGFLFIDPVLAFLEGMGKVKEIARMRMIQQSVYVLSVVTFLILGLKLYSSALGAMISLICLLIQVYKSRISKTIFSIWEMSGDWKVDYRKEIFPYQWKIALSWVSGYFIFQMFNPVLFATEGAVVAGQMGITLAALNGLMGLSMSWINTKVPVFSGLIAKKKYQDLDKLFFTSLGQSTFVTACGIVILFSGVYILQRLNVNIGYRFLPIIPLGLICGSYLCNSIVFGLATYLRCHKEEPLLFQSIIFAVFTSLSTFLLGNRYGVFGITIGYFVLVLSVSLPMVLFTFFSKRKLWHQIL